MKQLDGIVISVCYSFYFLPIIGIEPTPLKKEQILSLPRLPFRQMGGLDEPRGSNPKSPEPQSGALPIKLHPPKPLKKKTNNKKKK